MTAESRPLVDVLANLHQLVDERPEDSAKLIRTRQMDSAHSDGDELVIDSEIAIVLLALGHERAGAVLRHLSDFEVKELARAIIRTGNVPPDQIRQAVVSFEQDIRQGEFSIQGGWDFANHLLGTARDPEYAKRVIEELGNEEGRK